jgi:acetylornithine deacetylase/succinyl-diaminopimelate desuccinylase-like protein
MKGQVACEVAAAIALGRSGWRPASGELLVVVTCDEEAGAALGARWLCERAADKVRCDWVVNEGAGEVLDFEGRRYYTVCIGEKGVFRFTLMTEGRAGHASIPGIADNALLRMVALLGRMNGCQPELDSYPEGRAALDALLADADGEPGLDLARIRSRDPRLAALLEPMLGVTVAPTMISASEKENVIPSRCSVTVDCRVPPGMGADHVRQRVHELIGREDESGYRLQFSENVAGSSSPLDGPLADAIEAWVAEQQDDAKVAPLVLPGFTDSHWFRQAFPECAAYGFFPQRAMSVFDTTPLVHAADERIKIDDIALASEFYFWLAPRLLG